MSGRGAAALAGLVSTAALVVGAPPASAALPKTKTKAIVVGVSVGGLRLGMSRAQAVATWGSPNVCTAPIASSPGQCLWQASSKPHAPTMEALLANGKVRGLLIVRGTGGPAISAYKTDRGIGVGSTRAALLKAYPKAKPRHTYSPGDLYVGSGATSTLFSLESGTVAEIQVGDPYLG